MALFSGRGGRAARRPPGSGYHLYYCMTPLLSRLRAPVARRRLFAAPRTAAGAGGPGAGARPAAAAVLPSRARGGLVRPLLPFTRRDLVDYVAARGLRVHDDPANRDPRHLRSWIRTVLLPLVSERLGAGARDDVARAGRAAALERRAWDRVLGHLPDLDLRVHEDGFDVARGGLAGYDNALAVAVLRAAAPRAGLVLGPRRGPPPGPVGPRPAGT